MAYIYFIISLNFVLQITASPSSLPSSSAGYLQSINPTAATTVTSVVTLPAVTQSPSQNVYVQVRLLNVTDCSSWNVSSNDVFLG